MGGATELSANEEDSEMGVAWPIQLLYVPLAVSV
jgi:hypothetical protein